MVDLSKQFASVFENSKPWQRLTLVLFSGAMASLALPPLGFWPAIFIAFPVLVLVLDNISQRFSTNGQKFKSAFVYGWAFGFGYFVISLYWIGAAFLVEADKFAVLLPFAVAALPAGLAIFWGLAAGLSILMWKVNSNRLFTFSIMFTGFEWLRGHLFTGFPWNTIGYSSASMGGLDQLAAFSGLYGVTFFVLVCSLIPVLVLSKQATKTEYTLAGSLLLMFAAGWVLGQQRASIGSPELAGIESKNRPVIRIVQPNIMQTQKWDRAYRKENIDRYFQLSTEKLDGKPDDKAPFDIMVWPESALPLLYEESKDIQLRVDSLLPPKSFLLMGALRRDKGSVTKVKKPSFFNSLLAVNSRGEVIATYDKFHLVPFGEYLPAEKWLAPLGLRKIVNLPASFSAGPGPRTLKIGKMPAFSVLICYEISFSGKIIGKNAPPEWIVNVTNDGWFGKTAGPYQHLAQTRFRAIEQGLPIVRAANTGISAMINPYGTVVKSLALGRAGYLDAPLPEALAETAFARFGNLMLIAQVVLIWVFFACITRLFSHSGMPKKSDSSDK